jgi:hypothetical protein
MWQLIKAELSYFKTSLIVGYAIFLLIEVFIFTGAQFFQMQEISLARKIRILIYAFLLLTWAIYIPSFYSIGFAKEKRSRLYLKLPVPVRKIGMVRVFTLLFIWAGSVIHLFLFLLICGKLPAFFLDSSIYLSFCALTGAVLFWAAYILWMSDLKTHIHNRKKIVSFLMKFSFVLLYLLLAIITPQFWFNTEISIQPFKDIFIWLFTSNPGALFFLLLGFGISVLSVVSFGHRKTYVD